MKVHPIFLLPFLILPSAMGETEEPPVPTQVEARAQVETEMSLLKAREIQDRQELLAVPAESERVQALKDGGTLRLRRVATTNRSAAPRVRKVAPSPLSEEAIRKFFAEAKSPETLSLSVTVYDGEVSEIRIWHEGEIFHALSNVAFSHLQGLGSFEDDHAHWSVIAMVEEVDAQEEARMAEESRVHGGKTIPRKRPDTRLFFSMEEPEYLLFPGKDQDVPAAVFAKLDSLHAFYLANKEKLAAEQKRWEVLAEARRRYQEDNPPEPENIIVNHWRISEGGSQ